MIRLSLALAAVAVVVAVSAAGAPLAPAANLPTRCVGPRPGCYPTLQAAVDAAADGDTISLAPGVYAGGVTITKSVSVVGSGAAVTIVRGGGPVIAIGQSGAGPTITVSLSRLTITGGNNTSLPVTFDPFGGGVWIEPTAAGATNVVTISDSVIAANHAGAEGGGIADAGKLTLVNSVVSGNTAGSTAGQRAKGGGIWTASPGGTGSLTMRNDVVTGNAAEKDGGDEFRVEGGGIEVQDGETFSIANSVVSGNRLVYSSQTDAPTDLLVDGAGIRVGDGGSADISNTTISGNVATADAPLGEPTAADAGLVVADSTLTLANTTISGNRDVLVARSTEDPGPSGSVFEFDGQATISGTRIVDNSVSIKTTSGVAGATGAVLAFDLDPQPSLLSNSEISGNTVFAQSDTGSATIDGAGLTNNGALELRNDVVRGNNGIASAPTGSAQGGGIWNGTVFDPTPPTLTVDSSTITGNAVAGSPGVTSTGGGIFTSSPITLVHTLVAGNRPNQCVGC